MKKIRLISAFLAAACLAAALTGCSGAASGSSAASGAESTAGTASPATTQSGGEHEALTMTAMVPFRNPSHLQDLVHEKYPEINIEFIPYSGYNGTAFVNEELAADDMPDIYLGSMYTPTLDDVSDRLMDLSVYAFTDNFTDQRLREVTDDGHIYMLPTYYSCLAVTYNKTILEENGWDLPNSLQELEELAPKVKEAGYNLALTQVQFPGAGFQYLFNILSTGYVNTLEGRKWQNAYLDGTANFTGNADLMAEMDIIQRWRDAGMLPFNGDTASDSNTRLEMAKGNTLFMLGALTQFTEDETDCEFGYMPYLSEDGTSNAYITNVTKYVGLNKHLEEPGNEQKKEDALHVMEVLCTVEGMEALTYNYNADVLIPLKDYVIPEDSIYKPLEDAINSGHVAPYIYDGWQNLSAPIGEKMFGFMRGEYDINEVAKEMDADQHLLKDNTDLVYTTVTEEIDIANCAKLVGICFAQASGADVSLVSTNEWFDMDSDTAMNTRGVQCPLYAMPITDEQITAMLPTGWNGTIQTVTLTGARIKELAATGYDKFEDGEHLFPYTLVMPDGFALDDDATYTVAICGASKEVQEEGNIQDTGIVGLDAAHDYLSQFDTLSNADIVWENQHA